MNPNIKTALIVGGIALVLLMVVTWLWGGFSGGRGGWGGMMGPGMMGGWGLFGGLFMILFWVLVIGAIVALVRGFAGSGGTEAGHQDSPVEILKRRYARGEISQEEFEERKRQLS